MIEKLRDIWDWILDHKKISIGVASFFFLIFLMGQAEQHAARKAREEAEAKEVVTSSEPETTTSSYIEGTDEYLMSMQQDLRRSYGTPPKGFIWDLDGSSISLGDKSMSSEDVLYAYIRGISTLDFSTAQKYSRGAKVVETYDSYFSKTDAATADYQEQFVRNMYREALTSLEIKGIESSANFATNKVVYTVKVSMLDLTSKDFWRDQSDDLFNDMYVYESEENDSTKLELFLYDYILGYYKSKDAVKRELTFDITLERYPDIDSGWLVSIDKDIDDAAKYTDGKLVTNYITEQFRDWLIDKRSNSSSSN